MSGPPLKQPYGCLGVGCPQGGSPAAIYYALGQPMPYAFGCRVANDFASHSTLYHVKTKLAFGLYLLLLMPLSLAVTDRQTISQTQNWKNIKNLKSLKKEITRGIFIINANGKTNF
jgi:hypothetical protein